MNICIITDHFVLDLLYCILCLKKWQTYLQFDSTLEPREAKQKLVDWDVFVCSEAVSAQQDRAMGFLTKELTISKVWGLILSKLGSIAEK